MKLEMPITEVMELWTMTSQLKHSRKEQLDELNQSSSVYDYFKTELDKVEAMENKLEQLLLAECKILDEAKDWVINYKANAQI